MILLVLLGVALADPTIYFKETFEDGRSLIYGSDRLIQLTCGSSQRLGRTDGSSRSTSLILESSPGRRVNSMGMQQKTKVHTLGLLTPRETNDEYIMQVSRPVKMRGSTR